MKHTFKEGDLVRVKDTPSIRRWSKGEQAVGFTAELTSRDIANINFGCCFHLSKNRFSINFTIEDIELVKAKEIIYEIY